MPSRSLRRRILRRRNVTSRRGTKGRVEATVPYGTYKVSVSFLGYETLEKELKLSAAKKSLGTLELAPSSTEIEAVVKEVKSMRTSQKGDTVSYNAGAFKVTADADVEGLLKKMPGITITDGEVEAQGETVKKVFVDGKGVLRRGRNFGDQVAARTGGRQGRGLRQVERCGRIFGYGRRRGVQGDQYRHETQHASGPVRQALCRLRLPARNRRNNVEPQVQRGRQRQSVPWVEPRVGDRVVQQRQPAEFFVRGHSGRVGRFGRPRRRGGR